MELKAAQRLQASTFMPDRLVMIDCEMTGLDPKADDLIQIAAIKLELQGDQYIETGPDLNFFIHTDKQPASEFARKYMSDVYKQANESTVDYVQAKAILDSWLGDWKGEVSPCGDCVPTDVLFMYMKGVIGLSRYEGDTPVKGTFHYEYFDMNAIKALARQKKGYKFDKELERLPGDHDALVDCRNQLVEMNAIIKVLLS